MTGAEGAAYIAAISSAIKACGSIVKIEPDDFQLLIDANPSGCYVCATGGFFSTHYKYLTSYMGLTFHCKSTQELIFPSHTLVIQAKKISIPDL